MPPTPVTLGAVIILVAISLASASGLGVIARAKALLSVVVVAAVVVPLGFLSTLVVPAEEHHGPIAGSPERGEAVFRQAGCIGCHTITGISTAAIGPNLDHVATTAETRKPGTSAEAYIKESIQNPSAFIVPSFTNQMPQGLASGENLDNLVAFLLTKH